MVATVRLAGITASSAPSVPTVRLAGITATTQPATVRLAGITAMAAAAAYVWDGTKWQVQAPASATLPAKPFATFTLDGTLWGSFTTYAWAQQFGPIIPLSDLTAAQPTGVAPATRYGTQLGYQVTLSGGGNPTTLANVTVIVAAHNLFRLDASGPTPLRTSRL